MLCLLVKDFLKVLSKAFSFIKFALSSCMYMHIFHIQFAGSLKYVFNVILVEYQVSALQSYYQKPRLPFPFCLYHVAYFFFSEPFDSPYHNHVDYMSTFCSNIVIILHRNNQIIGINYNRSKL